jgi:predicted O-methyltransferase YrrM
LKKFQDNTVLTKNQKSLLEKVKKFEDWLRKNSNYNINIYDIDDGFAIVQFK